MLTTDIKYAVGIDFGHGETSFSYYNITWGKDIAGQIDTINPTINLLDDTKTIPSIYVYDRSKDAIYIGDEAANIYNIVGDHDNFVYKASFKKPISLMSDEEKSLFIKYMARIKIELLTCSPVNLQDEDLTNNIKSNYIVVIAKPSGWSTKEDVLYLNLAGSANLPIIGIWPESRASIMRFISKNDGKQANNNQNLSVIDINKIHEGCVLMDIGSSTTDFSYINKHKNYPIDDNGNDCGGQIIDELLLQYVLSLECNEEVRKHISESYNESSYNSLIYQIRKAKEALFKGNRAAGFNLLATYKAPESDKYVQSNFTICTMETVERLLNEGLDAFNITPVGKRFNNDDKSYPTLVKNAVRSGFIPALRYELASFITNHVISDNSQRINCFILTGGTVNVFKALGIDTYFKVKILPEEYRNCAVYTDAEPSTSVSDGLALVGRNYALFKGCINPEKDSSFGPHEIEKAKGLKNQLDELVRRKLETVSADSVKEAIADEIRNNVISKATSAVDKFAGYHSANPSLDNLKVDLKSAISSGCSNSGEIIRKRFLACLRSKLDETSREIETLVKKYTVQDVNMPSTEKYEDWTNINISVDVDGIIDEISTRVSGHVIIGILYLMLLPLATVIWGLTRIWDFFTDGPALTFEDFFNNFIEGADGPLSWVSSRGRLRWERERVQTKFEEKKSDISYDTYRKIKNELSGIDTIVNDGIKEAIETYKNDAYKAIERVFK